MNADCQKDKDKCGKCQPVKDVGKMRNIDRCEGEEGGAEGGGKVSERRKGKRKTELRLKKEGGGKLRGCVALSSVS